LRLLFIYQAFEAPGSKRTWCRTHGRKFNQN